MVVHRERKPRSDIRSCEFFPAFVEAAAANLARRTLVGALMFRYARRTVPRTANSRLGGPSAPRIRDPASPTHRPDCSGLWRRHLALGSRAAQLLVAARAYVPVAVMSFPPAGRRADDPDRIVSLASVEREPREPSSRTHEVVNGCF